MMLTSDAGARPSPMRLLEMLSDRFGLFEALAYSTIKLNRCTPADELAMDPLGQGGGRTRRSGARTPGSASTPLDFQCAHPA
ncbi:MAG TPA: hypothetical protein VEY93_13480 [Longimicrobium sp.]|nr:hypothetical protein [Longimicrobium sp.]